MSPFLERIHNGVMKENPAPMPGMRPTLAVTTPACPKGWIKLAPATKKALVQCSSRDRGLAVRKACTGRGKCAEKSPVNAIKLL